MKKYVKCFESVATVNVSISQDQIDECEHILIENGVDPDDAYVVLQAIGYVLLDAELYPED